MKLTLKKVKMFQGHDGVGLNADVYVDGVKTFFIFDGATGGESEHRVFDQKKYRELEEYAASLPEYPLTIGDEVMERDGAPVMCKVDIDQLINEELDRMETEKAAKRTQTAWQKKLQKAQIDGIVVNNDQAFYRVRFRNPINGKVRTIAEMLTYPKGIESIKKAIPELLAKYPDMKLFNTNIPKELL